MSKTKAKVKPTKKQQSGFIVRRKSGRKWEDTFWTNGTDVGLDIPAKPVSKREARTAHAHAAFGFPTEIYKVVEVKLPYPKHPTKREC